MRRNVKIGALAVVAVGLMFVATALSRANGCRVAPAAHCAYLPPLSARLQALPSRRLRGGRGPSRGCTTFTHAGRRSRGHGSLPGCALHDMLPSPRCPFRPPRSLPADPGAMVGEKRTADPVARTQLDSTPCDWNRFQPKGQPLDSEGCLLLLSRGSVQSLNVPWGSYSACAQVQWELKRGHQSALILQSMKSNDVPLGCYQGTNADTDHKL